MTIAERLAAIQERIDRLAPDDLHGVLGDDDLLVIDLRCPDERAATGVIPGSISVRRSTLEWRCDPASPWSDARVARPEARTVLVCADGYSSSLAAASLADLGFSRVGDLVGGMNAWVAVDYPVDDAAGQPIA